MRDLSPLGPLLSILLKLEVCGVTKYHHLILARLNYNELFTFPRKLVYIEGKKI